MNIEAVSWSNTLILLFAGVPIFGISKFHSYIYIPTPKVGLLNTRNHSESIQDYVVWEELKL